MCVKSLFLLLAQGVPLLSKQLSLPSADASNIGCHRVRSEEEEQGSQRQGTAEQGDISHKETIDSITEGIWQHDNNSFTKVQLFGILSLAEPHFSFAWNLEVKKATKQQQRIDV